MSETGETSGNVTTILVVDDDDDVRAMIVQFLSSQGYQIVQAANSNEAQQLALDSLPDLILMDIAMPHVDGLTAVWRMREHPALAEIPVVILSAYDSYDLRAEAASTGCQGYLTKPVEPDQLKTLIKQILLK
jgi:two-component system cell cycle response regulator DivK